MTNKKCNAKNCDSDVYQHRDKCVLHCVKSTDGFHNQSSRAEKEDFFEALRTYIHNNKKNERNVFVHIKGIFFPDLDDWEANIIDETQRNIALTFKECFFYGTKLELKNEVFFDSCCFCNCWNLFNYENPKDADHVIYLRCIFEQDVGFHKDRFIPASGVAPSKDLSESQFSSCTFKGQLIINKAIIKKSIFIGPISRNSEGNVCRDTFDSKVSFNECTFEVNQEFYIPHDNKVDFLFNNCHFGKKLKIRSVKEGDYENQQNNKAKLKSLKLIDCNADKSDYLRIGFLEIENFELSNLRLPQNSELNIGDCHFRCFELANFRNTGKFKLYKINVLPKEHNRKENYNPRFQIDNTSIGKTDFQSVNLNSFARVIMFDNIFTEIDYTNVQWKREIEVGQFGTSEKTEIAKKRDTYRTLKNVMIRNNDQQEALVFYQKEIEQHWKITKWKKEFFNKFTLAFNKCTNEFGLNWWKPLLYLFGSSVFFYGCLLNNLDVPILVHEHWQGYFKFLNPTHKVEFIRGNYWVFSTYATDFIFRLIEGLLIYQTIQAFRKYSRKL